MKKNEHYTQGGKFITDLFFELNGRYFHVEGQFTTDGRMIIRIMEYAMSIALDNASEKEDESFKIKFPGSRAIYLCSTNKTPDKLENQKEADSRMSVFMKECEDLLGRLSSRCSAKEQQYMFHTLADLIIEIAINLAPKNKKEKVRIMGGTVIETRAQILREEGRIVGEEMKARETAKKLQQRGNSLADIAGYAVEVVEKWLGWTPAKNQ